MRQGEYRRAMHVITRSQGTPATVSSAAALRPMFPRHDPFSHPIPPVPPDPPAHVELSDDLILEVCERLPRMSGRDHFGHSYELFQMLVPPVPAADESGAPPTRPVAYSAGLVSYVQEVYRGSVPVAWRGTLAGAQLFGLGKPGDVPDGTAEERKLRPICSGAILRRIVSRAVCASEQAAFGGHFFPTSDALLQARAAGSPLPIQTAVGVSGGMEVLTHLVQAHLDVHSDHVDVKVDAKNAFNAIHRRAILTGVDEHFPRLSPYTRAMYDPDYPGSLWHRLDSGVWMELRSEEGTQQGDPLGPFYFCLGIHPLLERVAAAHPDCIVIAYMDDVHILGPPGSACAAFDLISQELGTVGLVVTPGKCQAYSPAAMDQVQSLFPQEMWRPQGVEAIDSTTLGLFAEGHLVLGTPVGSDAFVGRVIADSLSVVEEHITAAFECLVSTEMLPESDQQCYFALLRCCVHPGSHTF